MNKLLVILTIFALIALVNPLIKGVKGNDIINHTIDCPNNITINYYYSDTCHACQETTPLIDEIINNGCPINKFNVREHYEIALANNIQYTPTLIVNDERIVGRFDFQEVKDLIISQL